MRGEVNIGKAVPRWGNALVRAIGRAWLRLGGWTLDLQLPDLPRFVVLAAPHTSNWDGVNGIAALMATGIRINWFAKHTLFRPPFRGALQWLGGIPVNRQAAASVVQQTAAKMREAPQMALALAPEGTRRRVETWKTGFYHIAVAAEVPIVCGYLDYGRKTIGTGLLLWPSGDYAADLARIYAFYRPIIPRHPENFAVPPQPQAKS